MVKLLSPITSFESATSVILAGADEIYCGVTIPDTLYPFIAQRGPPSDLSTYDELRRVTTYAHDHGVKTLLTTDFPFISTNVERQIKKHLDACINTGVDALIATNIGMILLAKEMGITIPIYASTYLSSINYEAVDFLRKLGVKRVVLERHVMIDEIKEIVKRSNGVEIEVFIHGPGCSNINVNCYGCCAYGYIYRDYAKRIPSTPSKTVFYWPLCRLEYDLYKIGSNESKKIASTPIIDAYSFCSLCQLPDLMNAGVTGLKIVGRELNTKYQEETTKLYREMINLIESGQKDVFQKKLEERKSHLCDHRCYYAPIFHVPHQIAIKT